MPGGTILDGVPDVRDVPAAATPRPGWSASAVNVSWDAKSARRESCAGATLGSVDNACCGDTVCVEIGDERTALPSGTATGAFPSCAAGFCRRTTLVLASSPLAGSPDSFARP